jgi:CHAD domain-containing protein
MPSDRLPPAHPALSWSASEPVTDIEGTVAAALSGRFAVREIGRATVAVSHLDTPDRRLADAGLDLLASGRPVRLALQPAAEAGSHPGPARWPATLTEFPAGPVVERLRPIVDVRALMVTARSRATSTDLVVVDEQDKTVVRLIWWQIESVEPAGPPVPPFLEIDALRGYGKEAAAVLRRLSGRAAFEVPTASWLVGVHQRIDPPPRRRRPIGPTEPARRLVARALLDGLDEIEANVSGILTDIDTEFLHEFRVQVRRTRSILKLVGDVLPDGLAAWAAPEFRWLGQVTTTTRDLDVYLLGIDALVASLTATADLTPFAEHIRRRRAVERRALLRALRSPRFAALVREWRAQLEAVVTAEPEASGLTARALAEERLRRQFDRVRKRARALDADAPAERVHTLRKLCKELRYLLELFRPLVDATAYKKVIGDFKELQTVLGEFQDGEVQAAALHRFAQEMLDDGQVSADVLLAMGELSARFTARQRGARAELAEHHDTYVGHRAARHLDRLLS